MTRPIHLAWPVLLWTCLALGPLGCKKNPPDAAVAQPNPTTPALGRAVYESPLADGNSFACATCHALAEPASDGLRRPGHPLGDATRRQRWKNGKVATFRDAVNSCLEEWMGTEPWGEREPRFVALRDFLDARAPAGHAPDLSYDIVQPPAELAGGDVARGRSTFDQTCVVCHGPAGAGTDRGPAVSRSRRPADYIAKRIRTSGSPKSAVYADLTGGVMPFWARDRLNDTELRDLVAYLRDAPADAAAPSVPPPADAGPPPAPPDGAASPDATTDTKDTAPVVADTAPPPVSGCPKTHPRVGWKANLGINTGEGEVSGFVTMIDDCTLELTSFSYNGDGIEVRLFGSKTKNFRPGFTIGPDIVGRRFTQATLKVTLPVGKTLGDLDYVSIWCVKARADFGSGPFVAPGLAPGLAP
jgi:mono/diheme cytochrome c family protein